MNTKQLKQKILSLAIQGKLVPQDPNDEPAIELLKRINPNMQPIVEDIPFEIPKGWCWVKLGELAHYKKGPFGSSLTKSMFVPKGNDTYKVYEQKNAIQKNETLGTYFITKEKYESLMGFSIQPYDIIVSCAGTIGETYVLSASPTKGIINQALMLIRLHNRSIESFYLLYFDFILKQESCKEGKGVAIKNIPPFSILKNFLIPIPPLAEQRRIVEKIETLFTLIDTIEKDKESIKENINVTRQKLLSMAIRGKLVPQDHNDEPAIELLKRINPNIQPIVEDVPFEIPKGWCWVKLGELAHYKKGPFGSSLTKSMFVPKGNDTYKVYEQKNAIQKNETLGTYFITKEKYESLMGFSIQPYDIIVSCAGTIGETYVLSASPTKGIINQALMLIRLHNRSIESFYLLYFDFILKQESCKEGKGVAIKNIPPFSILKNFLIPIPPLAEQKRIVEKLELLFAQLDDLEKNT